MSCVYQKIKDDDVIDLVRELVEKHHFELFNAEVKIDLIYAFATTNEDGEPTGPAIMFQGYPAAALARIIPLKDRVMGRGDCEIVIDGDRWPNLADQERRALVDHELTHFQLRLKGRTIITDDIGRPKIKLRKHDYQVGWFHSIAAKYGSASFEVKQFKALVEDEVTGQFYLPFIDVDAGSLSEKTVGALERLRRIAAENGGRLEIHAGDKSVGIGQNAGE